MKKEENLKEERLADLLKKADGHPMVKAILAEEADKILGARLLAAAKLRAATEEAERVIPRLMTDISGAEAELKEYDERRKVVLDKLTAAKIELAKARQSLDRERSEAEAALLSNYDPRIDEAIQFFQDLICALIAKKADFQTHKIGANLFTEKKQLVIFSNADAIKDALAYCRAAIREFERMRLMPALDFEEIKRLKKAIPNTDELREYNSEKPMSRGPDPSFLAKMYREQEIEL